MKMGQGSFVVLDCKVLVVKTVDLFYLDRIGLSKIRIG